VTVKKSRIIAKPPSFEEVAGLAINLVGIGLKNCSGFFIS